MICGISFVESFVKTESINMNTEWYMENMKKGMLTESEETKSASRAFGMPPNANESGSSPNPLFCNLSKQ